MVWTPELPAKDGGALPKSKYDALLPATLIWLVISKSLCSTFKLGALFG